MFTLSHPQEQPDVFNSHSLPGLAAVTEERTSNRVTLKMGGADSWGSNLLHHHD